MLPTAKLVMRDIYLYIIRFKINTLEGCHRVIHKKLPHKLQHHVPFDIVTLAKSLALFVQRRNLFVLTPLFEMTLLCRKKCFVEQPIYLCNNNLIDMK